MDQPRQVRLTQLAGIAVKIEAETGVPASAIVSQWALESEWGAKPAGNANYFGIKKAARHSLCCTVETHEVVNGQRIAVPLEFADYASLEDSCRDYAWLISHGDPYAVPWARFQGDKDPLALIAGIAHTYATDPNYAKLATTIAGETPVVNAIELARSGRRKPTGN